MKSSFKRASHFAGSKQLLLCASAAAALLAATPAFAQDSTPVTEEQDEGITVTGIRASIARAAEIKRNSVEMVDVISAEDLGKLPDTNIAEGLQRITGVQIQRVGGEGNGFQIRGATQNLTLVNGREVAPDADTASTPAPIRQVNLFNYPSEIFSEVRVYKSPAASLIEGGVGGTVDLRMPDPLKAPERMAAGAQFGRYSLQDKNAYGGSFLASRRFLGDTLGVVVGFTYFKRSVTTDAYSGSNYTRLNTLDVTGDGVADPNVVIPLNMTYNRELSQRERFTANALVAWQAFDTLRFNLELSYVKQSNPRARSFIGFNFTSAQSPLPAAAATTAKEADGSTTVLAGTFRNVNVTQDALNQDDDRNLYTAALGSVWNATDRLTVSAELGRSWAKVDQFANVYQLTQSSNVTAAFDIRPEVPTIKIVTGGSITDPAAYKAAVVNVRKTGNSPDTRQGRLDLAYDLDGFVDKILIGGRITHSKFDSVNLNNRFASTFPIGATVPATRFPNYIEQRNLTNFMGGAGKDAPTSFMVTSVAGNEAAGTQLLRDYGDNRTLQPIPASNYLVIEDTRAAYAQLDFGTTLLGHAFSGNVGLRYVHTGLNSSGSAVLSSGAVQPIRFLNDYDDWLPSLNLKWDLGDKLLVRGSVAKVMARPAITALSAGTTVSFGVGGLNQATSGQPLLKPFRATQYDLGMEYYFGDGGYVSGALFYKDIASYVTTTTVSGATLPGFPNMTFFLSAPSNGPGGRSKGFEVGVQRSFGFLTSALNDFGVIANFTYVDSKRNGSTLQIENTSKYSYNIIGYFESGPFQVRAAYNWRSSQYLGLSRGFDIYAQARGQLDASASFDITDGISLTVDGNNLLETPQVNYSAYETRRDSYVVNDRSILFGIRARF
ncbi:MAG: TonB-dependent receptor [Sphingomonas sp.]|uniref:TonB-dependent receptor n=1 Tax=Sphingomonas sp. TaxID=28214 RepID=UPI0025DDACFE|nr:TonB-dependent receptor [Sphingomonas sp.]MBX3566343.1 TonB-dependent receptor [Sphingomonas sp.]